MVDIFVRHPHTQVDAGPGGQPAYGLITYKMPNVSARMVSAFAKWEIADVLCIRHL